MHLKLFRFAMEDFEYDYDYEDEFAFNSVVESEHNVQLVYENCIQPSLASIMPNICDLIMYNLLFNVMTYSGWWVFLYFIAF